MEQNARAKVTVAGRWLGVNPWTLRRWRDAGKVPHITTETGRVFVPTFWRDTRRGDTLGLLTQRYALYARASSIEHTAARASQRDGFRAYATAKGYQRVHVVSAVASGMNDDRPTLHVLLTLKDFDILLVAHEEWRSRCGLHWFEAHCPLRIEVINLADTWRNDLMEDLGAMVTACAARLYGQRRGRQKTRAAITAWQEPLS